MGPDEYFAVDIALHDAHQRGAGRFNAYTVAYWAQVSDVSAVNRYLLSKVGIQLWANIEFICPNDLTPTAPIAFNSPVPDEVQCHVCGDFFTPDLDDTNIVFGFPTNEKKTQPSLLPIGPKRRGCNGEISLCMML